MIADKDKWKGEKLEGWTDPYYEVRHKLKTLNSKIKITLSRITKIKYEVYLLDQTIEFQAFTKQKEFIGTLKECEAIGNEWARTYTPQYIRG